MFREKSLQETGIDEVSTLDPQSLQVCVFIQPAYFRKPRHTQILRSTSITS